MAVKMLVVFQLLSSFLAFLHLLRAVDSGFPAVFNFGDSNSDTGELAAGLGFRLSSPYGQTFFHNRTGRFCDGRLIVDFLMDGMDLPFLNPYLDSVGSPNFQKGCNFAAGGSTILPATAASISPFSFQRQVYQFFRFKARVLELLGGEVNKVLPQEEYFKLGLYMFDIGQNDLAGAFYSKSEEEIIASIPTILSEFETGLRRLYDQGARWYWIHNTGPLGCLPENIAKFGKDPSKLDELGCVKSHNHASNVFNFQLHTLCKKLQGEMVDANITYVDVFSIKHGLIANFSTYGFKHPTTTCCGYGGPPVNYDSRVTCGQTKNLNGSLVTAKVCDNVDEYINWDGVHYTEAANHFVALQILTGNYSNPAFSSKMPAAPKFKF